MKTTFSDALTVDTLVLPNHTTNLQMMYQEIAALVKQNVFGVKATRKSKGDINSKF